MEESGFGFLHSGTNASYFMFTTVLPPSSSKASTSSPVQSSSFTDKICHAKNSYIGSSSIMEVNMYSSFEMTSICAHG